MGFYEDLIPLLKERHYSGPELSKLKVMLCRKHKLKNIPTDIEIFLNIPDDDAKKIRLMTKPTRTISGVAVVALMSAPISCPHGRCTFCPGGPGSVFGDTPQSYTGKEPSTMRAIRAGFDPYVIVFNRLEQYVATGHNFEKVEMIIQGGTFPSFDKEYQEDFVRNSLKALNDFSDFFFVGDVFDISKFKDFFELPGDIRSLERTGKIHDKIRELKKNSNKTLDAEQERNETARSRCVALCIETKPDFSKQEHIDEMLKLGTTRVELGVQTLSDKILLAVNRGHAMNDTLEASQLLKDSFLKVGFHMMPGLPGSSRENDIAEFRELFENPDFRPDNLKVYPCMVMPGTDLYNDWKSGLFNPITTLEAAEIIAESKRFIPEYCRVMRVQRDIPTYATSAGVDRTNLRQYVEKLKQEKGIVCKCIRCREPKDKVIDTGKIEIKEKVYDSSGGNEVFISAESGDVLLGFCRLRIPFRPFRKEITPDSAGIRELHVFGPAAGLNMPGSVQHRGLGKMLLSEAESIARNEFGKKMLLVISGIGAREYYKKLGYVRNGVYMGKEI